MAVDYFWKVGNIAGESQDYVLKGTDGWSEIADWYAGVQQTGAFASGGQGGGAGRAAFDDLTVTKALDAASVGLFQSCCAGTHFANVYIVARKAGGDTSGKPYLQYSFNNVLLTEMTSFDDGGEEPLEKLRFSYGSVQISYREQKADGTMGAVSMVQWSQMKNKNVLDGSATDFLV